MGAIHVRRMRFEYPENLPLDYVEGEPEETFANFGLSLTLPHLEPYLIRSMKAAKPHVTDPALAEALRGFVLQEGQHYQQHKRFNDSYRRGRFPELDALEAEMAADYERFTAEESLAFNLAYAEGFEALTSAMAIRFLRREDLRAKFRPEVLPLWEWHLVEELEHRCVAFDVYEHVVGDWPNRVRVGWFAQWHLLRFMLRVADTMIAASPDLIRDLGGERASRRRFGRLNRELFLEILPRMLWSHTPWYSPHDLTTPEAFESCAARYSADAEHVMTLADS